jgi:hypothetical protein
MGLDLHIIINQNKNQTYENNLPINEPRQH